MSLIDTIKPRKVLLLHSNNPNQSFYCSHDKYSSDSSCPYLDFTQKRKNGELQEAEYSFIPICNRYNKTLKYSDGFIGRCEKCERDKI